MLYDYCRKRSVPHKQIGKLVVAHSNQLGYLRNIHRHVQALRSNVSSSGTPFDGLSYSPDMVPETRLLDATEARELEPDLSPDITSALLSPSTGIVDSHSLMQAFESDILEGESGEGNGSIAYSTRVVRVDPHSEGFVVQLLTENRTGDDNRSQYVDTDVILARTLVNSSGLSANLIWNSLRPDGQLPLYFARGSYASYARKAGVSKYVSIQ
jgi:L-2-hydroxyglutarate oxidase LhgO